MKQLSKPSTIKDAQSIPSVRVFSEAILGTQQLCYLLVLLIGFCFASCKKQDAKFPFDEDKVTEQVKNSDESEKIMEQTKIDDTEFQRICGGVGRKTLQELKQAHDATAKFRNIQTAFDSGYVDINVVVPNMGYHFMKSAIVNPVFEVPKPEILVYNKKVNGEFDLVAVEYAVPLSASPDKAPEGFTGSADVWEHNDTFGLWLCHAWVWKFNPAGVFHDTNPLVQLH